MQFVKLSKHKVPAYGSGASIIFDFTRIYA